MKCRTKIRLEKEDRLRLKFALKVSAVSLLLVVAGGCKSRFIEATLVNQGPAVHVLEFDYPNASFGANVLATGATFHYRFKVQGSGPLALHYEDVSGKPHTADGPKVDLGDQGSLLVTIDAGGTVSWAPSLTNPK